MFEGKAIAFFMLTSFGSIFLCRFLEQQGAFRAAKFVMIYSVAAAMYCVAAGLWLAVDWHDPLAAASDNAAASGAVGHGRRGGLILVLIVYWPYALMAFGAYFGYLSARVVSSMSDIPLLKAKS